MVLDCHIDLLHVADLFLYPLKISKNGWYSDVFWRYKKKTSSNSIECSTGLSDPTTLDDLNTELRTHQFGFLEFKNQSVLMVKSNPNPYGRIKP